MHTPSGVLIFNISITSHRPNKSLSICILYATLILSCGKNSRERTASYNPAVSLDERQTQKRALSWAMLTLISEHLPNGNVRRYSELHSHLRTVPHSKAITKWLGLLRGTSHKKPRRNCGEPLPSPPQLIHFRFYQFPRACSVCSRHIHTVLWGAVCKFII